MRDLRSLVLMAWLIVVCGASTAPAAAQSRFVCVPGSPSFMDGVGSPPLDKDRCSPVESFGEAVSHPAGSAVAFRDLTVVKQQDVNSTAWREAVLGGIVLGEVRLHVFDDDVPPNETFRVSLLGAAATSLSGAIDGGSTVEVIGLEFSQIQWQSWSYDSSGILLGTSSFCWNVVSNAAC